MKQATEQEVENIYLGGDFAPVDSEVLATDLEVIGVVPPELEGRYIRNGPNPIGDVDPATSHWFSGPGMVHGVRLRGGGLSGIATAGLRAGWSPTPWADLRSRGRHGIGTAPPQHQCRRVRRHHLGSGRGRQPACRTRLRPRHDPSQ